AKDETSNARLALLQAEARNLAQIVGEGRRVLALQRVTADDRDRLRNVENLLFPLLCGDDDLGTVLVGDALVLLRRSLLLLDLGVRDAANRQRQRSSRA